MKKEIKSLEQILESIAAEDAKRDPKLPPNPHLADATTRVRLAITSLSLYAAAPAAAGPVAEASKP